MKANILTMHSDVTQLQTLVENICNSRLDPNPQYVCVSNVHMCMETFDNEDFKHVVNSANYVIPDGRPIFWAQRLLGFERSEQIRGQDLMNKLCEISGEKNLNIGFYGGSSIDVLDSVRSELLNLYPDMKVTYSFSPPFRELTPKEDCDVINEINRNKVDVLFVGIGCPKQEYWMAKHIDSLECVMIGVGAAFDFISGAKKHAPVWMQILGIEWVHRLFSEPRRLWKRYLKQNPRFIFYFLQQWLLNKEFK